MNFSDDDIGSIHRILAAILHLGNIQFQPDEEGDGSIVMTDEEASQVARLLGMEKEEVAKILTRRILASQKEQVETKLSTIRAKYSRDALAKVRNCIVVMYSSPECTCGLCN